MHCKIHLFFILPFFNFHNFLSLSHSPPPSRQRTPQPTGLSRAVYNAFMRHNSVYIATILGVAVVADIEYDWVTRSIWNNLNRGRLFDEVIPSKFPKVEGVDDDDDDDDEDDDEDDEDEDDAEADSGSSGSSGAAAASADDDDEDDEDGDDDDE